jgi:hypothetical protein
MSPAALTKAESLYKYATDQGALLSTFLVALTETEAAELLEWYALQYGESDEVFAVDLDIARRTRNPWPMLANFHLLGFEIAPAKLVLN